MNISDRWLSESSSMKFFLILCSVTVLSPLLAQTPSVSEIVSRARAAVGSERALTGVITLNIRGTLEPADPRLPAAKLRIIARKPCSQRMELTVNDIVETTILHGKSGCLMRSNLLTETTQMRVLTAPELDRVAYATRQFFSFYRPHKKSNERIHYRGIVDYRGVKCYQLDYVLPERVTTTRLFSVADASLVAEKIDNGVESMNVGTQTVDGINFPKKIEYYEDGQKLHTVIFTEIIVNQPLERGVFNIPKASEK